MGTPKRGALGNNPLSQGIFTKTSEEIPQELGESIPPSPAPVMPDTQSAPAKRTTKVKNKDSRFLTKEQTEKVNVRLSVDINDWLDALLKKGRRQHGHKIPKEVWIQAALELFRAMPVDWATVESEEALQTILKNLESGINNKES